MQSWKPRSVTALLAVIVVSAAPAAAGTPSPFTEEAVGNILLNIVPHVHKHFCRPDFVLYLRVSLTNCFQTNFPAQIIHSGQIITPFTINRI